MIALSFIKSGRHLYVISNYALAASLDFASVCFSWSRAEKIEEVNAKILKGGEYFMDSTIVLIFASLYDFGSSLDIPKLLGVPNEEKLIDTLKLGYLCFLILGTVMFTLGIWMVMLGIGAKKILKQAMYK